MNKKGFTLTEILVSITIVLLITTIAVPSVLSLLSKNSDKLDESVKKQLVSYAKTYMKDNDHINNIEEGKLYCILINDLNDEIFVDKDQNELIGRIEIKKENNEIKYTYNSKNNLNGCESLPESTINLDDEEIELVSNDNPVHNENTILGTIIKESQNEYIPSGYFTFTPDFHYNEPNEFGGYPGLYKTMDDDGTTYYFRGNVNNNYIKFDDNDTLFQITRFKGNGNMSLVSTEPVKDESGIPKKIEYDGIYCEDRKEYKLIDETFEKEISFDEITKMKDIIVYNKFELNDNHQGKKLIGNQDPKYPTLDKCINIDNPCKGKYISIFDQGYNNIFENSDFYIDDLNYTTSHNILKIGNVESSRTGNIIKYTFTSSHRINSYELVKSSLWSSDIKKELDTWFKNNMEKYQDGYIKKDKFCTNEDILLSEKIFEFYNYTHGNLASGEPFIMKYLDTLNASVFRLDDAKGVITPTYSCYKSEDLYVGTLTADDVVFAGAVSNPISNIVLKTFSAPDYANLINTDFFLFRDGGYHTLTKSYKGIFANYNYNDVLYNPFKRNDSDKHYTYQFNGDSANEIGSLIHSNISAPIYPVINVRGDVKFIGSGTKTEPFVIVTEESD